MSRRPWEKAVGPVVVLVGALVLLAQAAVAAAPNARASVQRGVINAGGKAFFPVMLLDQCEPGAAARASSLGINVILNATCATPATRQLSSLGHRQLGVLPIAARAVQGTKLLGWAYPDEPDNNHWSPSKLEQAYPVREGSPDGLLSFLTTTAAFYTSTDTRSASATTAAFAAIADVPGFDLYPLNHCRSTLEQVYDAQRRFARLAHGKPTFQWIETGAIHPDYCGGLTVTGDEVTAEAWLAVAGGARGIGFFTHTWSPAHSEFDVAPAVQQAIRTFATTAKAILPGLTGTTTDSSVDTSALRVIARASGDRTYVIAVNTLQSNVPATITVPRLRASKLKDVNSGRTLAVTGGKFQDTFPPLGVHVYVTS